MPADAEGVKPLYRAYKWNREERDKQKEEKQNNWFSKDGKYDQILMVPATPGGTLKKMIEAETAGSMRRWKIKVVEKPGQKLINAIKCNIKKTKMKPCIGENLKYCMICQNEKGGNCRVKNIVYQMICKDCQQENKTRIYFGETQRNGAARSKEHVQDKSGWGLLIRK